MGIFDAHLAGFHTQDAVRGVAELEHITGDAFHGEVFIDAADTQALRLQQYAVIGVVGDGAAAGHGGQARPASSAQGAADGVAVQVSAADALTTVVAFGEHASRA